MFDIVPDRTSNVAVRAVAQNTFDAVLEENSTDASTNEHEPMCTGECNALRRKKARR
jgi:hypothetical protein